MSASSKKDDEKTVFDRGVIGHNGGPELSDVEIETDADDSGVRTKRGAGGDRRGRVLSDADKAWLKQKEKAGELAKVIRDDDCGSAEFEDWERAAANSRHGVHSQLSRRGKLRVFRGPTEEERLWCEDNTWKLQRIATGVLHGPHATIFEKHVINPLIGLPKSSVKELAADFGKSEKRIYKWLDRCWAKIRKARHGQPLPSRSRVRRPPETIWENGFEFWVVYDEDGTPTESIMSDSREAKPPWSEPMEKWKLEEQQRAEKLREQIKLQAEARMNKQKESK